MPSAQPPSTSGRARSPRALVLCAFAALLAGTLLSACGGSSSHDAASNEQAQEREAETRNADFARCLREHGIKAETVTGPAGGHGLKIEGGGPQSMEAAQKACARYRPLAKKVNLSPQQKVEVEEAVQKFARCMREHGIKVETSTHGGGVQIGIHSHGGGGEPNPESPGFQKAQEACQHLMPKPPGLKGGAAGPPPLLGKGTRNSSKSQNSAVLSLAGG